MVERLSPDLKSQVVREASRRAVHLDRNGVIKAISAGVLVGAGGAIPGGVGGVLMGLGVFAGGIWGLDVAEKVSMQRFRQVLEKRQSLIPQGIAKP